MPTQVLSQIAVCRGTSPVTFSITGATSSPTSSSNDWEWEFVTCNTQATTTGSLIDWSIPSLWWGWSVFFATMVFFVWLLRKH